MVTPVACDQQRYTGICGGMFFFGRFVGWSSAGRRVKRCDWISGRRIGARFQRRTTTRFRCRSSDGVRSRCLNTITTTTTLVLSLDRIYKPYAINRTGFTSLNYIPCDLSVS
jgi:hypothetical protein